MIPRIFFPRHKRFFPRCSIFFPGVITFSRNHTCDLGVIWELKPQAYYTPDLGVETASMFYTPDLGVETASMFYTPDLGVETASILYGKHNYTPDLASILYP